MASSEPGSGLCSSGRAGPGPVLSQGRLPNLIIAGAVKSGTTSLHRYLVQHSDVCGSSVKETCFFLPLRYGGVCDDLSTYRDFFSHCRQQKVVLESTPGYLDGGQRVALELKKQLGAIRVVILLRDPIDRLKSFLAYQKAQLQLPADLTMEKYVSDCLSMDYGERCKQENDRYWGIDGGRYVRNLPEWFDVIGRENLRVLFFEHFIVDPVNVLADLMDWLDLSREGFGGVNLGVENRTIHYRLAWLQKAAISVNRQMEPVWRRVPALKNAIRAMYYLANAGESTDEPDRLMDIELRTLYEKDNDELARFLRNQGYTYLPAWLSDT